MVGERIREARQEAGLTQTEVARRCGLARPNLAAIESGARNASPEMEQRVLDAIAGQIGSARRLHPSPPVLLNVEMSRLAAFAYIRDPAGARAKMDKRIGVLRSADDGGATAWLDAWDHILREWGDGEIVALLLSTDPDDVELRKVSPISELVSEDEREDALHRAKEVWRATKRVQGSASESR